ncbi:MAG: GNAT family N-acetyltransferase [Planctomycetota bacterium]
MDMEFQEIRGTDTERLATWFPAQTWPYHAQPKTDPTWVRERAAAGYFESPETRAFLSCDAAGSIQAVVRVFDLADVTPLIDLRVADAARGTGVGTAVLRWVTGFVFSSIPNRHRLAGYTRADNVGMRRVFERCGYLREAHHRQAWRTSDGVLMDTFGYAVLRSEWLAANHALP